MEVAYLEAEVNTDNMQVQQWCNKLLKQKYFVFTVHGDS